MTAEDWPAVEAIYAAGISTGDATFEVAPPSWEEFDAGRLVGRRERIAQLDGVWRDTLFLERRL